MIHIRKKDNVESEIIDGKKYVYLSLAHDVLTGEPYYDQSVKYLASYVSIDGKIVKNPFKIDTNGGAPLGTRLR